MTDPIYRSARELLDDLRARRISARELLDTHVARDDALHATLNVVVDRDLDRASREAAAIDEARVGGAQLGPLAGLPMTIKDSFDIDGMPAVVGDPDWTDRPRACPDADVVATARRAGAVIWGKTNVSYRLIDWQSANAVYGVTNNPYDVTRTSGGSSGGSAAALAAGITPLEIGSDIGGSLRVPANFCGVYALKPTWNLLPQGGHLPPDPGVRETPPRDLNVVGPMARNPDDLRMLLSALTGVPETPRRSITGRRVGVWLDQPDFPLSRECRAATERAAAALEEQGAEVLPATLDFSIAEMFDTYLRLLGIAVGMSDLTPEKREEVKLARAGFKARLATFFDTGWDALLAPVTVVPAFPHQDAATPMGQRVLDVDGESVQYELLIQWISLATSLHTPSVAVPTGRTAHGTPAGVQLIGRWHREDALLDFADALDEVFGFQPPPLP